MILLVVEGLLWFAPAELLEVCASDRALWYQILARFLHGGKEGGHPASSLTRGELRVFAPRLLDPFAEARVSPRQRFWGFRDFPPGRGLSKPALDGGFDGG